MADVKNKQVNIYIDQTAAFNALEKLQSKADGFNKKIQECRDKQTQLLEKIKQSEAAALNIDSLTKEYSSLSKEIDTNTKKLADNKNEINNTKQQIESLSDKLIDAKAKQQDLADAIVKADESGRSTTRLQQQYTAVSKEIERTIEKINLQTGALGKTTQEADKLSNELAVATTRQKELNTEIKLADNAAKTIKSAGQQYENLNKTIASTTDNLVKNAEAQKVIQTQIDSGIRPSFNQMETTVKKLRNELKQMSEDAPGYAEKFAAFKTASTELDRLREKMNGAEKAQRSWLQEAKVVAFGVLIGNTVQSAIGAIGNYLSGIVSGNAKLSDSFADIQRVAGLSGTEVVALNSKLKSLDTRTAVSQLREIAIVAGKLGVAKEDIAGFTKSVDQLVVALGDELGDANQITTTLGKILNVFDGKVTGDNILKLGNAFVVLANAGVASGGFIADFTQRVSGIAKASNLSLGATVGLGAGLEELGSKVESSGTAVQKVVTTIAADIPKAAKIAGAKTKEEIQNFANLFARAPEEALLQFAEGITKNKSAFSEISNSLKDAGEDGARTVATIVQLGQKSDFFRQKIELGKKSLQETSAITDAFNLKNQTLGAELDKLNKKFTAFVQSKTLAEFFNAGVKAISGFIDVLKAVPGFISNNKTAFALIVVGIATMNASYIKAGVLIARDTALKLINATVTRSTAIVTNLTVAAQAAYIQIAGVLTGRITLATAAQRLWNIALSLGAGPIGAIIVAAGALIVLLGNLGGAFKTLSAEQKLHADIQLKAVEEVAAQKANVDSLTNAVKNNALTLDDRRKALQALINLNPSYLSGLTLENVRTAEGKKIIDDYIKSLDRMAEAKAFQSVKEDAFKKRIQAAVEDQKAAGNLPTSIVGSGFQAALVATGFGGSTALGKSLSSRADLKNAQSDVGAVDAFSAKKVDELNKKIEEERAKTKGLKEDSTAYKNEQVKINDLITARNYYLGISETQSAAITQETKVQSGLIDELKAKIEALDKALGGLTSKDAIKQNRAERQKLQDELDNLEGKSSKGDKAANRENNKQQELLKQLKDFQAELQRVGLSTGESEIARIKHKYENLIAEAKKYHVGLIGLEKAKDDAIGRLQQKEMEDLRKKFFEKAKDDAKEEYQNALNISTEYFDNLKDIETQRYGDGVISKEQYEENIILIDQRSKEQQLQHAIDYSTNVKEAEKDVDKFRKQLSKSTIDEGVKNIELLAELDKQATRSRYQTQIDIAVKGSKEELDARKNLLKFDHDEELKALEERRKRALFAIEQQYKQELQLLIDKLEAERKAELALAGNDTAKKDEINSRYDTAIGSVKDDLSTRKITAAKQVNDTINSLIKDSNDKFRDDDNKADLEHMAARITHYLDYASQVLNIVDKFNQARTASENRALEKELKGYDQRKATYKRLLDNRVISQQQYNQKVAALDAEAEKKKEDLSKRQFERNKRMQIAQALMSGAQAVLTTLATYGPPVPTSKKGIESIIGLALDAAITAAEVITISRQKFADGGIVQPERLRNGKITRSANIPTQSNGDNIVATVKTGEVLLNEEQQRKLGGPETFRKIGVPGFASGGRVRSFWKTEPYERINVPAISRSINIVRFAEGGRVGENLEPASKAQDAGTNTALLDTLKQSQQVNVALLNTVNSLQQQLDAGIEANVSLHKLKKAQDQEDRIKGDARLK
jgi:TP901 family phage tail tape measure protein